LIHEERLAWSLEMLNRSLRNNLRDLGLYYDRNHGRTYFPPENGRDRVNEGDTGRRRSKRTVTKRYQRGEQGDVFWAHQSATVRFIALDSKLFLRIEPGWTFTEDGVEPLPQSGMSSISTRWMFDEYNPSLFYHLRFWTFILSRGTRSIVLDSGDSVIQVETTPATANMTYGLYGDALTIDKMFEFAETETPPVDLLIEQDDD